MTEDRTRYPGWDLEKLSRICCAAAAIAGVLLVPDAHAQRAPAPVPVRGIAYDDLRGQPLRNATITLVGDSRRTMTDSRGRFSFDSVTPGVHTFSMHHATLDSLGFTGVSTRTTITNGLDEVKIAVPSFAALWRAACGGRAPADSGFVYGTVRDADGGRPVANAAIDLVWIDMAMDKQRRVVQRKWRSQARTDSTGSYSVCGVAPKQWLSIRASSDSASSGSIDLAPNDLRVQRRDLLIGATNPADSSRRGTISGTVSDAAGNPFAGARILVDGAAGARTGPDGRFAVRSAVAGTRQLEVSSVGMKPVALVVDVIAHDTAVVAAELTAPALLERVNVVEARTGHVFAVEYSERKKKGMGYTLDSLQISRYNSMPNVLASFPSTAVNNKGGSLSIAMPSAHGKGTCAPEIRIDGIEAGPNHLLDLAPKEIAAVEVYPRALTVPTQFIHGSEPPSCGMILVWTKYEFRIR
jgi:protocatechuate 3,4-dioxygenase beta subunit